MKPSVAIAAACLLAVASTPPASAWMHGYSGGGFTRGGDAGGWQHATTMTSSRMSHSSDFGGYDHSTQVGAGGAAHESNAGGYEHGSGCDASGCGHESDYGGYYHGTTASANGTVNHTGYYGTSTTSYGNYYHQPVAVNYYGGGCYNCGASGWGAVAAGAAVGTAVDVAAGAAASGAAYSAGVNAGYAAAAAPAAYAALPGGCVYQAFAPNTNAGPRGWSRRMGPTGCTTPSFRLRELAVDGKSGLA